MERVEAESLVYLTDDEVWNHPVLSSNKKFILVMDDGETITRGSRAIICWYIWILKRSWPLAKLKLSHQMDMEYISAKIIRKMRSSLYKEIWDTYRLQPEFDQELVWKALFETHNHAYNNVVSRLDRYIVGISAHEIVQLLKYEPIDEAIKNIKPTQASIDEAKDRVKHIMLKDQKVPKSSIITLTRCGVLDTDQSGQVLVARSYCTEIDSRVYSEPITVGYMRGFRSAHDSSIESRSAAKAQVYAKDPLAICEYFNRKLQLVAQTLQNLHDGDCGSQEYLPWTLETSELPTMVGVHYTTKPDIDSGRHQLYTLTGKEKDMIGQTIYLRTAFGCKHLDRTGVCRTCMGEMSYAVPRNVSPGHMAAIQIGEKISQLVLKTKHVDGIGRLGEIWIPEEYEDLIEVCSDENSLRLHHGLRKMVVVMTIPAAKAKSLPDIFTVNDVSDLNISTLTDLKEVELRIGESLDGYMEKVIVPTSMGSRHGYLTKDMLEYIKYRKHEIDANGNYVVVLDEWNMDQAIVSLPPKHISMIDFKDEVEAMLFSSDTKRGLRAHDTTTDALKSLCALIRTKANINFSWVSTMAYTMAAADPKAHDYRLARGGEGHTFCRLNTLIHMRSLGAAMAYQSQDKPWRRPETYVVRNRPSHPMDYYVLG